jgi:hypothetical protein
MLQPPVGDARGERCSIHTVGYQARCGGVRLADCRIVYPLGIEAQRWGPEPDRRRGGDRRLVARPNTGARGVPFEGGGHGSPSFDRAGRGSCSPKVRLVGQTEVQRL